MDKITVTITREDNSEVYILSDDNSKEELLKSLDYSEIVSYCLGLKSRLVSVLDDYYYAYVDILNNKVVDWSTMHGFADDFYRKYWLKQEPEDTDSGKYSIYDVYSERELL